MSLKASARFLGTKQQLQWRNHGRRHCPGFRTLIIWSKFMSLWRPGIKHAFLLLRGKLKAAKPFFIICYPFKNALCTEVAELCKRHAESTNEPTTALRTCHLPLKLKSEHWQEFPVWWSLSLFSKCFHLSVKTPLWSKLYSANAYQNISIISTMLSSPTVADTSLKKSDVNLNMSVTNDKLLSASRWAKSTC